MLVCQWISITNNENGKVAYGKTRDSCPGCDEDDLGSFSEIRTRLHLTDTILDLTSSLFKKLGNLDNGELDITWHFEEQGWQP